MMHPMEGQEMAIAPLLAEIKELREALDKMTHIRNMNLFLADYWANAREIRARFNLDAREEKLSGEE